MSTLNNNLNDFLKLLTKQNTSISNSFIFINDFK